jgi:hypothetical protein
MRCDKFLGRLETGGVLRQMAARWHAARCPRCARAKAALVEMKRDLASTVPLSDSQRRLWLQAGLGAAPEPQVRGRRVGIAIAATVAAGVLLAVAVALWPNRREPTMSERAGLPPEVPAVATSVHELEIAVALTELEGEVTQLQSELDGVGREAELLEARQRVTEILAEYSEW